MTFYSVDAVRFGIQSLAPEFFGGPPLFVVSGPNIGSKLVVILYFPKLISVIANLGTVVNISGTV